MSGDESGSLPSRVVIRPYPSVIYFYPTLIAALAAGLYMHFTVGDVPPADLLLNPGPVGLIFTLLFFFNLSVVAFDYTRLTSIVVVLVVVIVGLLSSIYPQIQNMIQSLLKQHLFMNSTFYFVWAIGFAMIFIAVFVKVRFNYWEIKNNELLHHHGFLGDVERWPAPQMRISKEISDVIEYVLIRGGRLVLIPSGERRAIVLDNVPNISKVEARMQHILSTLRVADGD
ncbi:MAG: hypothetical protein ACE366_10905 [Bradymonadia bacterium]